MKKTIEKINNEAKKNSRNHVCAIGRGQRFTNALIKMQKIGLAMHVENGVWEIKI